ncbi:STAS domain-containing protein [Vibrio sp. PP-XX7]
MMTHFQWHGVDSTHVSLEGALDREQIQGLWPLLEQWQPAESQIEFSAIRSKGRFSGNGFLLHLIAHAKKKNCHIMLRFVPEQLKTLFQLSHVDSLVMSHIID